ncbi:MAG: hypothetical protein LBH90_04530, partial [Tannerella sp.]|nr:hypothetical protein [Tannerella sp.]
LKTDLFGNTSNISAEEEKRSKYRINLTEKKIIQPFKHAEKEVQVKAIEKITVFYSDNTYETFIPEKKDSIIS